MEKKIIVTGANGFIGANLCNYLKSGGYDVHCLVRKGSDLRLLNRDQEIIRCDYTNKEQLEQVLSKFDIVIHCAALTKAKTFEEFYQTNVKLTEDVVNICAVSENKPQLVFLSSQAAAGPSKGTSPKKEDGKEYPLSWYGITKLLAERRVKSYPNNWTIIRPSSVYGEGDKDFLSYFKMVKFHLSPIPGMNTKYISLIYVFDLIKIIEKCLSNPKADKQVFHAADDAVYTVEDFLTALCDVMGKKCINFRVSDKILCSVASSLDYVFHYSKKPMMLNKEKALELSQESWLLDSKKTTETLETQLIPDLHGNLKKTYKWYREKRYL